ERPMHEVRRGMVAASAIAPFGIDGKLSLITAVQGPARQLALVHEESSHRFFRVRHDENRVAHDDLPMVAYLTAALAVEASSRRHHLAFGALGHLGDERAISDESHDGRTLEIPIVSREDDLFA